MTESDQLKWGSHLAPLLACIGSTVGPVLELGVGDFSTPALHALCCAMHRRLVSVESDFQWCEKFRRMEKITHEFVYGDYDAIVPKLAEENWAVSFIDNSPGGERRARDFAALLPVSQFVVVHDYEHENKEAIAPLLAEVNTYSYVYSVYEPPTLIASVHGTIPRWIWA